MRQRIFARSTSRWKLMFAGSVESQYLVGSASPSGHSISSHSGDSFSGISLLCPTLTRTRAKREDSHSAEPSRHLTVRQACFGRPSATSLAEIRPGSSRRPVLFSGLPFRDRKSGRVGKECRSRWLAYHLKKKSGLAQWRRSLMAYKVVDGMKVYM